MGRFRDALAGPGLRFVAEVKRRSPSAGDIRPGADPATLARSFELAGAAAVSILVDDRFGGSVDDLRAARSRTNLPLLAKGFFSDTETLASLRAAGADAVLIILRDVNDAEADLLIRFARSLGMDALVEAHDGGELGRAVALGADPIGLNARDLATFLVDRRAQLELVATAPRDRVIVAESGIETRAHGAAAELAGAAAVLVGSALMRARDPAAKLRDLAARPLVKVCGLTRPSDVQAAVDAGADMVGFVLAESPRRVESPLPAPDSVLSVAVLVGSPDQLGKQRPGTDLVQVYPAENGHRGREGVLFRSGSAVAAVLDLPWLGRDDGHWPRAAEAARHTRVVLAGGLGPANVEGAISVVGPWCVDASRSLETAPGIKDPARIQAFVDAVRVAPSRQEVHA
jgi:indole-3-glycerol phosphate synthase/phosphoribosylanthranilate isomerase